MKQTLLISALALSAGLANAQTMMEMPKVQNAAVKALIIFIIIAIYNISEEKHTIF